MSLILCRQEPVRHPFYIERLGVHIASSQELCYIIYQNPLLVLDGFVDDRLIEFIRSELGLSFLAGKLEAWQRSGENQDELPIVILQECCYYTAKEIAAYRQKLAAFRKMNAAEFRKETADYYFRLRQFGTAIYYYMIVSAISFGMVCGGYILLSDSSVSDPSILICTRLIKILVSA